MKSFELLQNMSETQKVTLTKEQFYALKSEAYNVKSPTIKTKKWINDYGHDDVVFESNWSFERCPVYGHINLYGNVKQFGGFADYIRVQNPIINGKTIVKPLSQGGNKYEFIVVKGKMDEFKMWLSKMTEVNI